LIRLLRAKRRIMQNGNLYGLIIAILSLAVTIVLAMQHIEEGGFHLELIIQPAKEYVAPSRPAEQLPRSQSRLVSSSQVAFA
jgi:hypothetical protein